MDRQIDITTSESSGPFDVAGWHVNPSTLSISDGSRTTKLEPKVMAVLEYLADKPGIVVSRQELELAVWSGTVVGYDAISNAIIKLRKAFGDKARDAKVIETISSRGYRLIAPISAIENGDSFHSELGQQALRKSIRFGWENISAIILIIILLTVGGLWHESQSPQIEPAILERMALALPDKPSIAVLPFINISNDQSQEYFADGITEDLITDLSKHPDLFVISRNSTFIYKGRAGKVRMVAEELGVRYVLEGSVRRVGTTVRINAQLIDTLSGGHIWSDRYDGSLTDIFKLQDQVTSQIVSALSLNLTGDQPGDKITASAQAYDLFLKGWRITNAILPLVLLKQWLTSKQLFA